MKTLTMATTLIKVRKVIYKIIMVEKIANHNKMKHLGITLINPNKRK